MRKTIPPEPMQNTLNLFVYGTLKRGYWNHDRFCRDALQIEEAEVWGRLYEQPSGIPVLQVPDGDVIAVGTSDPLKDVAMQWHLAAEATVDAIPDTGDWQMIRGELMVFDNPRLCLPPIDQLEGFRPGKPSLYRRVLVPIFINGGESTRAWCYIAGEHVDLRGLTSGRTSWPK